MPLKVQLPEQRSNQKLLETEVHRPTGPSTPSHMGQIRLKNYVNWRFCPAMKPLIGVDIEDSDMGFRVSTKPRNSFNFEPYSLDYSQESQKLVVLPPKKPMIDADLEDGNGCFRKLKKAKDGNKKELKSKEIGSFFMLEELTKTLMETQEFGEMMEHEDEV